MKGIIKFLQKYWIIIIPVTILLLFIISIWDRNYYIGGDLIFPLKPQDNVIKFLYLWEEQNGGLSFFKYMLFFLHGFFYVLSFLKIPVDIIIKVFIVMTYILGFTFSYLFYRVLFKETEYNNREMALVFASLYVLSPAGILTLIGTLPLYGFPICFYFLVKYLDTKNILYSIPFAFFLNIVFFPDLPQAKLFIVFIIAAIFLLVIYSIIRKLAIKLLVVPFSVLVILTILLNAFVLIPFVNDAIGQKAVYQQYSSAVTVYSGDADYLSASLPYITRFYNSNLITKSSPLGQYLTNPLFIIWTFCLLIFSLLSVFCVRYKKREKSVIYISLFAFALFVFIAKGSNPPFGQIYGWVIYHIPLAKLFRTTATVIIGGLLFYSLLITVSLYHFSRKWRKILYIFLAVHIILFFPIYLGYKLDNLTKGKIYQKGVSIPNEYFQMGELLDSLKDDGKILILPLNDGYITKSWGYSGQSPMIWLTKKPLIANSNAFGVNNNLDIGSSNELCSFLSLYNIRYFLEEKDTTSNTIKKDIDIPAEVLADNQYFTLRRIGDSCFLPHILIPNKTIYFKGNIKQINFLSYLPGYKKNSAIFQDDKLIDIANNVIVGESSNNTISFPGNFFKLYLGKDELIHDVFYPGVSVRPDSVFYPLIAWKEENGIKNDKLDTRQLIDLQIIFALKRISEIDRWGIDNSWWQNSQNRYKETMENAIQTAKRSDHVRDNLELIFEYLEKSKQKIKEIAESQPYWDKEKTSSWETMFVTLEKDVENALYVPDYNNLTYTFNFPYTGNYQAFLLGNNGKLLNEGGLKMDITLDNKNITSDLDSNGANLVDLGNHTIDTLTKTITIHLANHPNYIDSSSWIIGEQVNTVQRDSASLLFGPNQQNEYDIPFNETVYQEIKKWEQGETYLLRIRHKDYYGASLQLVVRERKEVYDKSSDSWVSKESNIVREFLNSGSGDNESKVLLKADKNATQAWIYLYATGGSINVENVELKKIIVPHIFFVDKKNNLPNIPQTTAVSFTKINPTKYIANITDMKNPFFLTFSEGYDQGWKLYETGDNYLSDKQHFRVNGYANAWYINPRDINGKDSAQFIVEYAPQKLFYRGLAISGVTLVGIIIYYILYTYYKKKRYNK